MKEILLRRAHCDLGCCARDIKYTTNQRRDGFVLLVTRKSIRLFAPAFVCHTELFHVKQRDHQSFCAGLLCSRILSERKRASQQENARHFLSIVTPVEVFCLRVWVMHRVQHDVAKLWSDPYDYGFVIVKAPGTLRRRHNGAQSVKNIEKWAKNGILSP